MNPSQASLYEDVDVSTRSEQKTLTRTTQKFQIPSQNLKRFNSTARMNDNCSQPKNMNRSCLEASFSQIFVGSDCDSEMHLDSTNMLAENKNEESKSETRNSCNNNDNNSDTNTTATASNTITSKKENTNTNTVTSQTLDLASEQPLSYGEDFSYDDKLCYIKCLLRERKDWIKYRTLLEKFEKQKTNSNSTTYDLLSKFPFLNDKCIIDKYSKSIEISNDEFEEIFKKALENVSRKIDQLVFEKYNQKLGIEQVKNLKDRDLYFEDKLKVANQKRTSAGNIGQDCRVGLEKLTDNAITEFVSFSGRADIFSGDF